MSKNALIKNQARLLLRGNWVPVITGWVIVMLTFMTAYYMQSFALLALDQIDSDGKFYNIWEPATILIVLASYLCLVFLSPLINGAVRLSANLVKNRETFASEMFYYFTTPRLYFKTLLFNLITGWVFLLVTRLADAYGYASRLLSANLGDSDLPPETASILIAALIVSVIIYILTYFLFVHFQLIVYSLEPERGAFGCTVLLLPFVFRHFAKALSLFCGFIGWFLLCFFVVPAMYTVPYFITASVNEVYLLLEAEKQ